jgi:hypothetical protein
MVEYKHSFNAHLAFGLRRIYEAGKAVNLDDLDLNRNQWDNFQKLRYWDLVEKAFRDDGTRIRGAWRITPKGTDFVEGRTTINQSVWTYRGDTVRFEGDQKRFDDVHESGYAQRDTYAAEAVAHHAR